MEIIICTRSKQKAHFIEWCINYFISELKLKHSKYTLVIYSVNNLRKNENAYGQTGLLQGCTSFIGMSIDSRLKDQNLIETIAHEMVHVKQLAKGQLKYTKARNGRIMESWLGKRVKSTYWNAPWEREAYRREKELSIKLVESVQKRLKSP